MMNAYANSGGVSDWHIARQMQKRWTGFADAMNGSALERVYMRSDLKRLQLKDGTKGPITSLLIDERIVLTNARGLCNEFNQELFGGMGLEMDIKKEIEYWQNWEQINKSAYGREVEEAENQWEGNTCQDGRYVDSDGNTEVFSDEEWDENE
jgi:hypothetical protein